MRASALLTLSLLAVLGCAGCRDQSAGIVAPAALPAIDEAPPAVPAGLAAAAGPDVVKLQWLPNTADGDFAGYKVYRLVDDRQFLLTPTPLLAAEFIDRNPWRADCSYGVVALDQAGNRSPLATIACVRRLDIPQRSRP